MVGMVGMVGMGILRMLSLICLQTHADTSDVYVSYNDIIATVCCFKEYVQAINIFGG